ncbi:phage tail spike protein [Bacillus mycoides]|uniref:phage tail spike protein n=1 Tax=Bacillus mycoides TaxID=1405 RepID=UPI0029316412|nr:phage tail spike protein [Bacillus mycoides]WOA56399.1 phage tail spike protein [Bacillus mycoides]
MITLYKPTETDFTHNGIGILDDNIYDAVIEEELNGLYVLSFKYPLFAPHGLEIGGQCLIKAPTPDGDQLFRVARPAPSMGELHVFCYHVFYDLVDNLIEDTFIQEKDGQAALQQMKERMQYSTNFNFISDISTIASSRLVEKNPVEAILDNSQDNSFLSRWGGELKRDNFTVHMLRDRGRDRGVVIQHKKDLLGYESDVDWTNVITRMMPKGFDGLLLPEKYVESYNASKYIKPKIRVVEFDHIKAAVGDYADDEDAVPLPQAYEMLRDAAKKMYDEQHVDLPKATYKVEFQELSQTEEYKDLAVLQRVYMGDTVTVIHEEDGFEIEAKVNSYKYDPINEEYIELTLGNYKESFADITGRVDNIENNVNNMESSILEQARENATNLINSGFGGHVRVYPERILIMDTKDERTAKKVWQWNINGFGYSSTGINGPYNTAITMDGRIVADFITTGTLNGNLVRGGEIVGSTIRTDGGPTYVNLQKQNIQIMESDKIRMFLGYYFRASDNQLQPTILMHDSVNTSNFRDGTFAMSQFPNTAKTMYTGSIGIVNGKDVDGTPHYASRINFDTSGDTTINSDGQFTTDTFRTRIESTDNIDVISGGKLWMGSDLNTNIVAGQNTVITAGLGISQYANGGSYWVESQNSTVFTVKDPAASFFVDAPKAIFKCGVSANGVNVYDNSVDSTGTIRYMNGAKGWGFYGHIGSPGWAYFTLS